MDLYRHERRSGWEPRRLVISYNSGGDQEKQMHFLFTYRMLPTGFWVATPYVEDRDSDPDEEE
ncbi:MAG: hypothetical protein PHU42_04635, partial [Patescibacteria group bacterium]|nr:hypothetical protein [Patescibacteria group bacterium]